MLTWKSTLAVPMLLLLMTPACGGDDDYLYIVGFVPNKISLVVGQPLDLNVRLSDKVKKITYVDITNDGPSMVSVEPPTALKYNVGEYQQTVNIKGLAQSNNIAVNIRFDIRDTDEYRVFPVTVETPNYPDAGVKLDQGGPPPPDTTAPTPDAPVQEDGGMPPDGAVAD